VEDIFRRANWVLTYVTAVSPGVRPLDIALTPDDGFAFSSDNIVIAELTVNPSTGAVALSGTDQTVAQGFAIDATVALKHWARGGPRRAGYFFSGTLTAPAAFSMSAATAFGLET
jgi:hypothetical protein